MVAESQLATTTVIVTKTIDERVYKPFYGRTIDFMQRLLTGKENGVRVDHTRFLISPKNLARARLGMINSEPDTKYLNSVYVDTSTAVIKDSKTGRIKYSPNNILIYTLNPETRLVKGKGRLIVTPEQYTQSEGFELTKEQAERFIEDPFSQKSLRRRVWEECFMEGNTQLTIDYIKHVETLTGYKFSQTMGLYMSKKNGLSLLCVGGVDHNDTSNVDSDNDLCGFGRLVGVAVKPQIVAVKTGIPLEKLI